MPQELIDINDVELHQTRLRAPDTKHIGSSIGRRAALQCLDNLLLDSYNIQMLRESLQDEFNVSPAAFFKYFVMPLLPKESSVNVNTNTVLPLQIVMVDARTMQCQSSNFTFDQNIGINNVNNVNDTKDVNDVDSVNNVNAVDNVNNVNDVKDVNDTVKFSPGALCAPHAPDDSEEMPITSHRDVDYVGHKIRIGVPVQEASKRSASLRASF